ncbi:IS1595 family transposase [Novosphingobium beihaiensis]|uniref:IS1595 family transposase n=1 Tax=Novosphingobium beihaiensis TaxID=2930389 RepID=A0ABT0BQL7_9SPHN|nr:IS1595 family transposase [Novosphingobium beihaiensis]MCJ2187339.1 IS1595 family transposase [Novosphingobium beihaiensis]
MAQHFLLSSKARTLSLKTIYQMGEDKAYAMFRNLRWQQADGEPICPRCGCLDAYDISSRRKFQCKACGHQYSVTSGTIFAGRKLSFTDLLAAIMLFVNGAKGVSALQMSRDLDVQYKTAFVLAHKLREAMALEDAGQTLAGEVEVDGAYFGGHVRPANEKENRRDRRLAINQSGKRQVVVVGRERGGESMVVVAKSEAKGGEVIAASIHHMSTVHADEASHWDDLHAKFDTRRINHSLSYSDGIACTNQAESFFSRLRRMEVGTHHRIAGKYLHSYAAEASWREDNRRVSNGGQAMMVAGAAMASRVSRQWKGYWQRAA